MSDHPSGQMVLKNTVPCSFCAKKSEEVTGLAGAVDRAVAICGDCAELSMFVLAQIAKDASKKTPPSAARGPRLKCSFCDRTGDVVQLVGGPTDHICERCIRDAAAILES